MHFSTLDQFQTKSVHFDWNIDFDKKQITGSVTLSCHIQDGTTQYILDTRELNVESVEICGEKVEFKFGDRGAKCEALGVPLIILPGENKGTEICIKYNTTEKCSALQWLTKEQTCGGKHPYLFSQCQVGV